MTWKRPYLVCYEGESVVYAFREGQYLRFMGRTRGLNRYPLLLGFLRRKAWDAMSKHDRKVATSSLLTRLEEDQPRVGGLPECRDGFWSGSLPLLWEVLAYVGDINGKLYVPGQLYISVVAGRFRAAYYHSATDARVEFTADRLEDALLAIEQHLAAGQPLVPCQRRRKGR